MMTDKSYAKSERECAKQFGTNVDSFDQGPHVGSNEMTPAANARRGLSYDFYNQYFHFAQHFNQICERLGYDIKLVDEQHIESQREVEIVENEDRIPTTVHIRSPIGINLKRKDPTLSQVLDAIEKAYSKLKEVSISSEKLKVVLYT